MLGDRGTVLGAPVTTAPGSTTEPTPVYLTVLGPRDAIEQLPDGSLGIVEGGRGVRLLQRRITPALSDGCTDGTAPNPPAPLILGDRTEGCVVVMAPPVTGAPEDHVYWFRRDGIQFVLHARSVEEAEVLRIAESLR